MCAMQSELKDIVDYFSPSKPGCSSTMPMQSADAGGITGLVLVAGGSTMDVGRFGNPVDEHSNWEPPLKTPVEQKK